MGPARGERAALVDLRQHEYRRGQGAGDLSAARSMDDEPAAVAGNARTVLRFRTASSPGTYQRQGHAGARRSDRVRSLHGHARPVARDHPVDLQAAPRGAAGKRPLEARGAPRSGSVRRLQLAVQEDAAALCDVLPQQHRALSAPLLARNGSVGVHGPANRGAARGTIATPSSSAIARWIGWSGVSSRLPATKRLS